MTIYEAAEARGIEVFDSALPQNFVDAVQKQTGQSPVGHFVWSYDRIDGLRNLFGIPAPITREGDEIMEKMKPEAS